MDKNINNLRWDPSVCVRGAGTTTFWKELFVDPSKKVLFILGKGFDVRMNMALQNLLTACPSINIECWLIEYEEGTGSSSIKYKKYVDENLVELHSIIDAKKITSKKIALWDVKNKAKRKRIGDRQAAQLLNSPDQIKDFSDIIIDISALPKGVYFSLIGKFLKFIDSFLEENTPNLFVAVSENAEIDIKIKERGIDEDVGYLHGFGGTLELSSESDEPIIWFPILGEDKSEHLERANNRINPNEICPVLPFPSKNPRRSDSLIAEYHQLLFDKLSIEPQNLMYVPEQNPFEVYGRLAKAIINYYNSLQALGGCKVVISTFSSKLLSIGTLLAAYELIDHVGVGVLNVDSQGYDIDDFAELKKIKGNTELFVIWLTGEPYDEA